MPKKTLGDQQSSLKRFGSMTPEPKYKRRYQRPNQAHLDSNRRQSACRLLALESLQNILKKIADLAGSSKACTEINNQTPRSRKTSAVRILLFYKADWFWPSFQLT